MQFVTSDDAVPRRNSPRVVLLALLLEHRRLVVLLLLLRRGCARQAELYALAVVVLALHRDGGGTEKERCCSTRCYPRSTLRRAARPRSTLRARLAALAASDC